MGQRGPVPNRSDDLSRLRDANRSGSGSITKGLSRPATIPEPDPDWCRAATMIWDACLESGQSDFYESSDWALLWSLLEDLSRAKSAGKVSGQLLQTIYSAMSSLLLTEGDRRRVQIELQDPEIGDDAEIKDFQEYQRKLGLAV